MTSKILIAYSFTKSPLTKIKVIGDNSVPLVHQVSRTLWIVKINWLWNPVLQDLCWKLHKVRCKGIYHLFNIFEVGCQEPVRLKIVRTMCQRNINGIHMIHSILLLAESRNVASSTLQIFMREWLSIDDNYPKVAISMYIISFVNLLPSAKALCYQYLTSKIRLRKSCWPYSSVYWIMYQICNGWRLFGMNLWQFLYFQMFTISAW